MPPLRVDAGESFVEMIRARAQGHTTRILFPEARDARVLAATTKLVELGIGTPVVLDAPHRLSYGLAGVEIASAGDEPLRGECIAYLEGRVPDPSAAAESPLMVAAAMLGTGRVDAVIAGCTFTSGDVLRAAIRGVGVRQPEGFVSTRLMMLLADAVLTYGDCAMNPTPTAEQLATIAIRCADGHRRLTGEEPLVALLSFSTLGSADHPRVVEVRRALERVRQQRPDIAIDGELQLDAAISPAVAARKAPRSSVAGRANVLVFPDLDAANIACKLTECLAGARMVGPYTEGLERPFLDLSRSCQVDDIVDLAAVLCCST